MRDEELREAFATRRRPAQVRRHEPGDRPRRRPRDHPLHGAAGDGGASSSRACGSPTRRPSRWRRWSCSARSTPTSSPRLNRHGQPAVGPGRRGRLAVRGRAGRATPSDVGFVGEIERVDVDVLDHIADDYIPVIASVGTDRDGQLLQRQRRRGRRQGRRGAAAPTRRSSSPTSTAGSRDPDDPGSLISRATVGRGRGRARRGRRRDAAEADRLRRRDPRRRGVGPHHRRPAAPLAAARALHRRRNRHDDHRMKLRRAPGARGALRDADLRALPVEFVRGEGALALGLRGQASTSTSSPGSRSARSATATRTWSRRCASRSAPLTHTSNLYLHRAGGAARRAALRVEPRRQGVSLQLGHRGQRVRDQARPQARPRPRHREARDRGARGRLPRPDDRLALGDARACHRRQVQALPAGASAPSRATTSMRSGLRSASRRRR